MSAKLSSSERRSWTATNRLWTYALNWNSNCAQETYQDYQKIPWHKGFEVLVSKFGLLLFGRCGGRYIHIARFDFFDILKHDGTGCIGEFRKTNVVKDKAAHIFTKNNRSKVFLRTVKIDVFEGDVPRVFGVEAPNGQGSGVDAGLSWRGFGLFSGCLLYTSPSPRD